MTFLYLLLGLIPPTLTGWLLLQLLQGKHRVLYALEQWMLGCALGLTLNMLLVFIAHAYLQLPFTFWTFTSVQLGAIALLSAAVFMHRPKDAIVRPVLREKTSRTLKILLGVAGIWLLVKTTITAVVFLGLVPTYLDDTLDNWNLRGKVFFYDQALTLSLPSEDAIASPKGVSSYPPTVPMIKTWLSTISGEWNEPLINSVHIVWYIVALTLVFFFLRRFTNTGWSALGVYLLGSMPLYLIHGTNAYGDAFLSVHVLAAAGITFIALQTHDHASRMSFFRIGAVAAGLLTFTKNESLLIYLPPLILMLCVGLALQIRSKQMTIRSAVEILAWYAACIALFALPWLIFKWMNGLTFGNAKPFTELGIGWQEGVVQAILVNTFMEGNWLFMFALMFALIMWRWHAAFGRYLLLTSFIVVIVFGQWFLYLFTGLSPEARMQTGLARGGVQMLPMITILVTLLLAGAERPLREGFAELARKLKIYR